MSANTRKARASARLARVREHLQCRTRDRHHQLFRSCRRRRRRRMSSQNKHVAVSVSVSVAVQTSTSSHFLHDYCETTTLDARFHFIVHVCACSRAASYEHDMRTYMHKWRFAPAADSRPNYGHSWPAVPFTGNLVYVYANMLGKINSLVIGGIHK